MPEGGGWTSTVVGASGRRLVGVAVTAVSGHNPTVSVGPFHCDLDAALTQLCFLFVNE